MKNRKVKILVVYRNQYIYENDPILERPIFERYTTTFIIDECYLLEFLPSLVREDIESIEVEEYDK